MALLAVTVTTAVGLLVSVLPTDQRAKSSAPRSQPGPPLGVSQSQLDAALECTVDVARAGKTPVLLVPGTGLDPAEQFAWNWEPALTELGIPWCALTLPEKSFGDIQIAGEYLVSAIRTMHERADTRISIIGHSQGGMAPRWALRFWPDVRAMVDDLIGLAPSNHGTIAGRPMMCITSCAPADWQQRQDSKFIEALNSEQETFAGVSYTNIYTHADEIVIPNLDQSGSSSLRGGGGAITNVAIQQVCPGDPAEHLVVGISDHTAYALAVDALTQRGPADPARVPPSVCDDQLMPGIDPQQYATQIGSTIDAYLANDRRAPQVPAEPPLRCYVTATCPDR